MMTPIVNGVRSDYGRELEYVYADVEKQSGRDLARQYGTIGYPSILFLDSEGNKVNTMNGVVPRAALEKAIDDLLAEE